MVVTIMTSNNWPSNLTQRPPACILPRNLMQSCQSFEKFYLSRHSGRRLTWQLALGNADVRVSFKIRKHDLNVSTYALIILLLFEDVVEHDTLTYEVLYLLTYILPFILFIFLYNNRKLGPKRHYLNRNLNGSYNRWLVPSSKYSRNTHLLAILMPKIPSLSITISCRLCNASKLTQYLPDQRLKTAKKEKRPKIVLMKNEGIRSTYVNFRSRSASSNCSFQYKGMCRAHYER